MATTWLPVVPTPSAVLLLVSQVLCRFAMGDTAIDAAQPSIVLA